MRSWHIEEFIKSVAKCTAAAPLCCKRGDGTYGCTDVLVGCR
jgi:hypothetical protein